MSTDEKQLTTPEEQEGSAAAECSPKLINSLFQMSLRQLNLDLEDLVAGKIDSSFDSDIAVGDHESSFDIAKATEDEVRTYIKKLEHENHILTLEIQKKNLTINTMKTGILYDAEKSVLQKVLDETVDQLLDRLGEVNEKLQSTLMDKFLELFEVKMRLEKAEAEMAEIIKRGHERMAALNLPKELVSEYNQLLTIAKKMNEICAQLMHNERTLDAEALTEIQRLCICTETTLRKLEDTKSKIKP